MKDLFEDSGAHFSSCRKYRYALYRIWDDSKPLVMFIGLNPSTANENEDDPTIRRVKRFARDWGFGGVYMMNLFAYITPYPDKLILYADPIGNNDAWLKEVSEKCGAVVFAWGSFKQATERAKDVSKLFTNAMALRINKDGTPAHPLYIPANVKPVVITNQS